MKITRKTFDEVMFPCYTPMNMVIKKAHGSYVFDNEGNKYVDLTSGIAVNCLGHTPDGVQKVIKKTCKNLIHVSNIFCNEYTLSLAKKLTSLTGYDKVFFVNSGAEANETALKLARRVAFDDYGAEKNEIISFVNSFHGRTFFSVTVGGQESYSDGFGPKPAAITHIPYNDIATFEKTISDKTCAVILEPIQGEGGIIKADDAFLVKVRELCDKYHAALIFDEVQTGVARSGTLYAYEQTPVKPDILTSAKGLASGLPIGAVLTYDNFAKHFVPGTHGSTFGGNALACSVGCYVLDKVSDKKFLENVKATSEYIKAAIRKLDEKHHVFDDVRGEGLLMGLVLNKKYSGKSGALQKECFKHKLLTLTAHGDVLRLAPALNIKKSVVDEAMKLLDKALTDFVKDNA
ncbi:MAG: acetylornithine/succinyldiaminopimelate transaminase [Succinivibrio sp.]|nr:acetylornithine/succinyldiaminopimelate transaminase [Succinatimonas sp.]MDD6376963.1 acetylornithine/succinyldiaminopimelate transaminase [Succinatimonas sp.]MDY5064348.1 acetylornithine/succinyldiaminopimelate transaminase [Succinivibrio sp.]PWM84507.1 MAG: aspartate aminotransferase family protein [Succinivibrio sp.]